MKSQSHQQIINKCFYEQTIILVENSFKSSGKNLLDLNEILDEIKKNFDSEDVIQKKKKKESTLADDARCIAIKKDKARCNGKKNLKGDNPLLCPLHNKRGANYGLISEGKDQEVPDIKQKAIEASDDEVIQKCNYTPLKGKRKGRKCSNMSKRNSEFCELHCCDDDDEYVPSDADNSSSDIELSDTESCDFTEEFE